MIPDQLLYLRSTIAQMLQFKRKNSFFKNKFIINSFDLNNLVIINFLDIFGNFVANRLLPKYFFKT